MPDSTETPAPAPATGMCSVHPDLRAAFVCGACGREMCGLCAYTRTDGSRVCTACANSPAAVQTEGPRLAIRGYLPPERVQLLKCIQHPNLSAVHICRGCGAPMCATCEFLLPGDLRLCPRCVVAPPKRMSGSRRNMLIATYVLAAYGTLGLALFTTGALASMFNSPQSRNMLGLVFSIALFFPAIIGAALAIGAIDRRLSNPAVLWVAAVWNCLLLGIHILLIIIGSMKT